MRPHTRSVSGAALATPTAPMDAFDRDARVWSPVWSPESANDALKDGKDVAAEVDLVTMRW